MKSRKSLLVKLLDTLLDEWGAEEVSSALSRALQMRARLGGGSDKGALPPARIAPRPTAVALVEKAELHPDKREKVLFIARKYDLKEFLPSVADVRHFIIMAGERPVSMKDRIEAFRVVLKLLSSLPSDRVDRIKEIASHSGPTQLGPISDAIGAASKRINRRPQNPEPNET